ncbi:MAG: single-stranded DNA-binding protein [Bifidobacterium mongoliense]|jgi:single-strand DNA-binding protein|uniref:single-stranded DNA-binding protein n=1 Tax=Bifidobacterium mongoliense TaxID=518643 RepID=UPI002F35C2C8
MSNETTLTIIGNLTADPEVRTIGTGNTVANFTIASTPRTYNRETSEWEDGQALFMRCAAWRDLARNVADSLAKGMRVIASGHISQRSYQAQDGSNRTVIEMTVDEIGPSLRYASAQVKRANKSTGFNGQQGDRRPAQTGGYSASRPMTRPKDPAPAPADPWGTNGNEFGGNDDEPQF